MARVIHLPTGRDHLSPLQPAAAVVDAYVRQHGGTAPATPEHHPAYRRGRWGHHCGDFSAKF